MPKRKRSDYESSRSSSSSTAAAQDASPTEATAHDDESTRAIAIHQRTVEQKIHHHRTILKRALKTAKGFEQQKLGKRIKAARKATSKTDAPAVGTDLPRLESELAALKTVDLAVLSATYLAKTLVKNRQLSTARYFPPSIIKEAEGHAAQPPIPTTGPVGNVCARLLNANPVRDALREILGAVGRLLVVEGEAGADDGKTVEESTVVDRRGGPVHTSAPVSEPGAGSEAEEVETRDDEDDEEAVHPSALKNLAASYLNRATVSTDEEDEDEDEEQVNGRIAWSSEDEDEDEDQDGGVSLRPRGRSMSITPIPEDQLHAADSEDYDLEIPSDSDSNSDSGPAASGAQSPPPPRKKKPAAAPPASSKPITSSSFLPTLMTGYISGSDSDASSDTTNRRKKGPAEKKIRKNRMGQQARRALAEKKYGTSANHITKARSEKEAKANVKLQKRRAWEEKQNKSDHVSWELKRRDKEAKDRIVRNAMAGTAPAMGKKIVFD
ncbi:hypothetical protein DRE_03893 [Drechslerella stenobrocha 248]|uniref:Bud22 domain-containing protein n=1 Tax=Drechslerella stenobrocha 248 TaxID=1043628 RepID=W7HS19_9PEZI|nr:hypothetical protein DRE_03893 [Drechslerella stenobrocha 248]